MKPRLLFVTTFTGAVMFSGAFFTGIGAFIVATAKSIYAPTINLPFIGFCLVAAGIIFIVSGVSMATLTFEKHVDWIDPVGDDLNDDLNDDFDTDDFFEDDFRDDLDDTYSPSLSDTITPIDTIVLIDTVTPVDTIHYNED